MSRLHLTPKARQLSGHAPPPGYAATNARRNAPGGTLALALVPKRPLPAQEATGARAPDHQMGRGCVEWPSTAISTMQLLRQQGRRSSASERSLERHRVGFSREGGGLALWGKARRFAGYPLSFLARSRPTAQILAR